MPISSPYGTPNLYGYPVWGNMDDHMQSYLNEIAGLKSMTSSAVADEYRVFLAEDALALID